MHYISLLVGLIQCDIFVNAELNKLLEEKNNVKESVEGENEVKETNAIIEVNTEGNTELKEQELAPKTGGTGGGAAPGAKPSGGSPKAGGGGSTPGTKPAGGGDKAKKPDGAGASKGSGQISTINVNGKEAVMVKGSWGTDVPSVVVISDQGVMKNETELLKLASEIGGSVGKGGSDKKTPGGAGDKKQGSSKPTPGGKDAKTPPGGGSPKPTGEAPKQKLQDVSELQKQGFSLLSFESEEGTQEGEKAKQSLDKLIEVSKKKNNKKPPKEAFWTTVLVDNNPRMVLVNIKTITVLESISDKKIEVSNKKTKSDKSIKASSGSITQKESTKQTDKKKEEEKTRSSTQKEIKNKVDNKKSIIDGIKYESPDVKSREIQKKTGEIFGGKKDTVNQTESVHTKRLNTGETSTVKGTKQSNHKESVTSKASSAMDKTQSIFKENKPGKKKNQKSTAESVIFMGSKIPQQSVKSDKGQKKETKGKDKEASIDDLLYVLKNMPGKVNLSKGGKELYVEGNFQTPKEEKMGKKKYKFVGLIKSDNQK